VYRSLRVAASRSPVQVFALGSEGLATTLKSELKRLDRRVGVAAGFRGDGGEVRVLDDGAILVGLGKRDDLRPATLRTAGARLVKALDRLAARAVTIAVHDRSLPKNCDRAQLGRALGEGMALANWRVTAFDGSARTRPLADGTLSITASDQELRSGISEGLAIATSVNYARDLAATPPNVCTPQWVAAQARRLATSHRLRCRVIGYAEAMRLGMGGLAAVGRGSAAKPCLVLLEWRPAKVAKSAKDVHLCLVGKTVTYDTGGYSLKVNNGMKGMKYDKCGGTAVLGAMRAIAESKLPVRVSALLPAAENMVSDDSYRPDDIITMHNGVTVEVTNTDAEGRLILADALSWGAKTLKPTHVIDIATLTGGVVTALGNWCAGVMANDPDLLGRVERAGEATGDRVWELPVWSEHRDHMRSQHADIVNSNPSRLGHPLQGGAFLSFFVEPSLPWVHVDIAGTATAESANDLHAVPGPTGFGVRLLHAVARGFAG
jgi:leucyl aminopeptidase